MKKTVSVFVIVMLVLNPFVLAEPSEDCGFFCKAKTFFSDVFGSKENIAGSATCSGFWECYFGRENVAGEQTDEKKD